MTSGYRIPIPDIKPADQLSVTELEHLRTGHNVVLPLAFPPRTAVRYDGPAGGAGEYCWTDGTTRYRTDDLDFEAIDEQVAHLRRAAAPMGRAGGGEHFHLDYPLVFRPRYYGDRYPWESTVNGAHFAQTQVYERDATRVPE